MVLHPWHEVSTGKQPPQHVNALIEIPRGSKAKYEIDKESGLLKLDRVIYASMYYPLNYGFIPQTLGEDHDPLDIVVLTQVSVVPLCIIPSKVIGVMQMIDRGEADDKIIAVAEQDPSVSNINDVDDLPQYLRDELQHFFENYKTLENKKVVIDKFLSKDKAYEIISNGIGYYRQHGKLS
ncbi:inorganic diphosphatase [Chryseosolibacter indicus]|uniref:Inorganic pyrophosphatase n=1 Tax=Chryseosolibacter indicus TaxID=2782351 RepID=A0ABS5VJL1_9BACT|nr:inorganic diphosphatase [Chryseosolibacter indicus]MBT1701649.1 inorganic diphosphatase [Chryseosolibacter indicus]